MSPFNAWAFIQGLETLPLRMREHGANALKVAEYLENNDKVSSVTYPGISEGIEREREVVSCNFRMTIWQMLSASSFEVSNSSTGVWRSS